ncbi:nitronate monooxygenase [Micromonospora sp. DR5-3]|uniref:NAD(P)H-dependent flavin oxidoreductase n=1 Tax=unclassified Micromonospora TaxID=2617518 RepID=UPI001CA313EE|nr:MULTISPECIES: nitronate monooxygenase [unclassified Micromonospora]MCW3819086.1 nitronate monooxygenase [Micromonospora sp. DR5-3]
MPSALHTRACELFGVRYPIVQTGMGYVSDPRLTAATANAGGLGILSAGLLSYEELAAAIDAVQARTDRPFGVNLRADQPDVERRIDLLISAGVRVASFALAPRQDLIGKCKDAGLVVVPSIGARRHAEKVAAWGVDAVIVQGGEGGGHTGGVPTSLLLPQVVDAVDIPVIGAGGFFDGRGLVAALAYGAAGIAMGTRFLLTTDSPVAPAVKEVYLSKTVTDTVLTREVDGVPQRVLRAGTIDKIEKTSGAGRLIRAARNAVAFRKLSGSRWSDMVREGLAMKRGHELTWSQVVMAANAPMLYRAALLEGRTDLGIMATGQVVGLIDDLPSCQELIDRIMAEAAAVLGRLGA